MVATIAAASCRTPMPDYGKRNSGGNAMITWHCGTSKEGDFHFRCVRVRSYASYSPQRKSRKGSCQLVGRNSESSNGESKINLEGGGLVLLNTSAY